jgi:hypothetical protein
MVKCVCGKSLTKVPAWLESVEVEFICNNCPQRQIKPISQLATEAAQAAAARPEETTLTELEPEDDAENEPEA